MCAQCRDVSSDAGGMACRRFHLGLLASATLVAAPRLAAAGEPLVERGMRLDVAAGEPRTVAVTLDACSGATDDRILDTLIRLNIAATIFVTGLWLRDNPTALARLCGRADLFTLQNHGERHLPAVLGTTRVFGLPVAGTLDAIRREVSRGADAVASTGAARPGWYRCATGLYSPASLPIIEATGARIAGWSLNSDAGASLPAETVARRIAGAQTGEVIIAHINQPRRASGAGVAAGLYALHAAGTRFVGLQALPVVDWQRERS